MSEPTEETFELTLEDHVRFAMQDHIDTLQRQLDRAMAREANLQHQLETLIDRLGKKSRWW